MSRGSSRSGARTSTRAEARAQGRSGVRSGVRGLRAVAVGVLVFLAAGCSAGAPGAGGGTGTGSGGGKGSGGGAAGAARTVRELGRVPIPTAPVTPVEPTASPGHAQLVAMGDVVHVLLGAHGGGGGHGGSGRGGTIVALGPEFAAGSGMDRRAGRVTVRTTGAGLRVCADELAFHDELGRTVPVHPLGPSCGTGITLAGTFHSGHATLTWTRFRLPVVTWDFEVELD